MTKCGQKATTPARRAWIKKFGDELSRQRRRACLAQHELSELVGVNKMLISRWEAGSYAPRPKNLALLIDLFPELGMFAEHILR